MTASTITVRHGFSARPGGVSGGAYSSLNLGDNRGDEPAKVMENYRRLCQALGMDLTRRVPTSQVHGREVRTVTEADLLEPGQPVPYEADGLVTNVPGLPIMCFTADCVPVLLHDPAAGTAAAVHCGWKSSVLDILGQAVIKMEALGARPENIRAAIGPSIGACCFQTDADVAEALRGYLGADAEAYIRPEAEKGKFRIDLRGANARRLIQLGVAGENIAVSRECTMCMPEKYWSHRAVAGGARGTQGAVICL